MSNHHHNALIVEGGAMRSVFSAGLLDGFLKQQFNPFDFFIGVSAGASNLITYLAGTPGKSLQLYRDFASSKECINYLRFTRGGHLLDLDWLADIFFEPSRIDLNSVYQQTKPLYICITEVSNGKPVYIETTSHNLKSVVLATTALPVFYRGFPLVNNKPMTDGGIADGIPVAEAIRMGAKNIMVVRSRHQDYMKKDSLGHKLIRWHMKSNTALTATMRNRVNIYKNSIALIRKPPAGVKIIEICSPDNFAMGRFNRNPNHLMRGYHAGLDTTTNAIAQWISLSNKH